MKRIYAGLLVALLWSVPVAAQTYLTSTTLSNAIDATQTSFAIASATGVAAGGALYFDREYVTVRSVSGTTVTVNRGQAGTVANSHTASRTVIVIPAAAIPTVITDRAPAQNAGVGGCSITAYRFLPIIQVTTGDVWLCRWVSNVRVWAATNETLVTYNSLVLQ